MNKKNLKTIILVISIFLCLSQFAKSQILDVSYRNDTTGCGKWCWAKSTQMIIVYYGQDVHLCDVLEKARRMFYPRYGYYDCCEVMFEDCCDYGYFSEMDDLLERGFSLPSTYLDRVLTLTEVNQNLSNNRPFLISVPGHAVTCYGKSGDDIYFHDPGNGSQIHDYYDLLNGIGYRGEWYRTIIMDNSATNCLLVHDIPGVINSATSIYKAQNEIKAHCDIISNSEVEFKCGGTVNLKKGFEVEAGSTLLIETGVTLNCP